MTRSAHTALQPERTTTGRQLGEWQRALCRDTDPEVTPVTKLVGLRLSMYLKDGVVWASRDRLAADCSLGPATVQRHRAKLVERGALVVERAAAQRHATRYTLGNPDTWRINADTAGSSPAVSTPPPAVSTRAPRRIRNDSDVSETTSSRTTADTRQERLETPRQGRSTGLDTSTLAADPARAGARPVAAGRPTNTNRLVVDLGYLGEARRQRDRLREASR